MSLPSFGTLSSEQAVGQDAPKPETPFRIAVLGDFSGRSNRGLAGSSEEVGRRKPRKLDRESLDGVLAKLEPSLLLPVGPDGATVELSFRSIDDFHPDAVSQAVDAFADCFDSDEKTALMNAILHHADFQALEACWRGLDWMLQRTSRCQQVEFRVFDLSLDELLADLTSIEELESTGLYQILVDAPASRGDLDPWSLFIGNYLFDLSGPHADALGRIAKIARQSSAPFLAGVNPAVTHRSFKLDDESADAWGALRALPEAAVLGLATPRFLLRLPYGANTRSIDAFEYEECDGRHDWNHYLWGNPAYACAVMLAQGFDKDGWAFQPSPVVDLQGMPLHATVDADGDPRSVTAEAWLVRERIAWLTSVGLMPLLCVKGRDAVQLSLIQSLAVQEGAAKSPLLGRWGQKDVVRLPRTGMQLPVSASVSLVSGSTSGRATGELGEAAAIPVLARSGGGGGEEPSDSSSESSSDDFGLDAFSSSDEPGSSEPADPDMDPELATLMAGSGASSEAADPDMDPELAALLAGSGASSEPAADPDMDPELAALLAGAGASSEPAESEEPAADPDLDALMKELEG